MTKAHLAYAWLFSDYYVFSVTFHLYFTFEVSILTYNQYDVHSKYKIDLDKLIFFWKIIIDCRWKSNNQLLFDHNWWQAGPMRGGGSAGAAPRGPWVYHNSSIHFCCTDSLLMTHRGGLSLSIIIWSRGGGQVSLNCPGA